MPIGEACQTGRTTSVGDALSLDLPGVVPSDWRLSDAGRCRPATQTKDPPVTFLYAWLRLRFGTSRHALGPNDSTDRHRRYSTKRPQVLESDHRPCRTAPALTSPSQ